jgi:hypothetical protein
MHPRPVVRSVLPMNAEPRRALPWADTSVRLRSASPGLVTRTSIGSHHVRRVAACATLARWRCPSLCGSSHRHPSSSQARHQRGPRVIKQRRQSAVVLLQSIRLEHGGYLSIEHEGDLQDGLPGWAGQGLDSPSDVLRDPDVAIRQQLSLGRICPSRIPATSCPWGDAHPRRTSDVGAFPGVKVGVQNASRLVRKACRRPGLRLVANPGLPEVGRLWEGSTDGNAVNYPSIKGNNGSGRAIGNDAGVW